MKLQIFNDENGNNITLKLNELKMSKSKSRSW